MSSDYKLLKNYHRILNTNLHNETSYVEDIYNDIACIPKFRKVHTNNNRKPMMPINCVLRALSRSLNQNPDIILPEWMSNPYSSHYRRRALIKNGHHADIINMYLYSALQGDT